MDYFPEDLALSALWTGLPWLIFILWIFGRVFRKAGRPGWWVILMAIPGVNIVMLWVFSFIRWPGLEVAQTKQAEDVFS